MKQVPPRTAKLTKPGFSGILERKRLFHILDISKKTAVIWITGPAGSGKTTLISSYLDSKRIPCLWYSIDEGDSDIATFFYYMGIAAQAEMPGKMKPLPLLTPEYLLGIPAFTKRYFEELYNRMKKPSAIVFDNYQNASDASILHDVMAAGLSVMPKGITLIFLSRSEPPSALSHVRFSNPQSLIGWNELRLTREETAGLIKVKGLHKSEEMVSNLHQRSDGWFAGLVLMLAEKEGKDKEPHTLKKQTPEEIFNYFAREIFSRTDKDMQQFLLKTVFIPGRTPKMAEELTGQKQAGHILMELSKENYFTAQRTDKEHSYEFHPLFKEFLIKKAGETFSLSELLEIKKKAASVLESNGQLEAAVTLYYETGDMQNLIRIVLSQAQTLLVQGRHRMLMQWIQLIPEDIMNTIPWLLYWLGLSSMPFSPKESVLHFEKAFSLFDEKKDVAGVFISWSGIVYSIVYGFSEYLRLDPWIEKIDHLLKEYTSIPSREIEARFTSSVITALVFRRPDHADLQTWIERGLAIFDKTEDQNVKFDILAIVFYYRLMIGDFKGCQPSIEFFRKVLQSPADAPFILITILKHLLAAYFWITGECDECIKTEEEALQLADETGVHILDDSMCLHAAAGAMSKADMKTAKVYLERVRQKSILSGSAKAMCYADSAWYALLENNLGNALFQAESSLKSSLEIGYPHIVVLAHFGISLAMYGMGNMDKAEEHLKLFQEMGTKIRSKLFKFMGLLAKALFSLERGNKGSAIDNLSRAMTIGKDQGYVNFDFWFPSMMTKLCMKALEEGIEVEYVRNLIRKRNLMPESPPLHIEHWPWHLKVSTLGTFGLARDGMPIVFSKKSQNKPLLMLKALLSTGGKEIKEHRLADLLWPDSDGDAAYSAFTTTLSRLRQLLGDERWILFREGMLMLNPRYCWVDAWAFEKQADKIEEILRTARTTNASKRTAAGSKPLELRGEIEQFTQAAMSFYKGPFLPGDEGLLWTASYRERLRMRYLGLIRGLADYFGSIGEWEKAAEHYERAIEVNEHAEEFYRNLMICYSNSGNRSRAMAVYELCRKMLLASFGIQPEEKTEAIYKKILNRR